VRVPCDARARNGPREAARRTLRNVALDASANARCSGRPAAGRPALLNIISGLIRADRGETSLFGDRDVTCHAASTPGTAWNIARCSSSQVV